MSGVTDSLPLLSTSPCMSSPARPLGGTARCRSPASPLSGDNSSGVSGVEPEPSGGGTSGSGGGGCYNNEQQHVHVIRH